MTLIATIAAFALLGLLFLVAAARSFRRRRLLRGLALGATAVIIVLLCVCAGFIGKNLLTYRRLTAEQPAGQLRLSRTGDEQFSAVLALPTGEKTTFALDGDEWQVDARLLKWTAFVNLLGFDSAYRLERISGRYTRIEDERKQPRTVYELATPGSIDPWALIRTYHRWLPWLDATYGSATYLPMSDGAIYEIQVAQSGLIARPLNQAANDAVSSWH